MCKCRLRSQYILWKQVCRAAALLLLAGVPGQGGLVGPGDLLPGSCQGEGSACAHGRVHGPATVGEQQGPTARRALTGVPGSASAASGAGPAPVQALGSGQGAVAVAAAVEPPYQPWAPGPPWDSAPPYALDPQPQPQPSPRQQPPRPASGQWSKAPEGAGRVPAEGKATAPGAGGGSLGDGGEEARGGLGDEEALAGKAGRRRPPKQSPPSASPQKGPRKRRVRPPKPPKPPKRARKRPPPPSVPPPAPSPQLPPPRPLPPRPPSPRPPAPRPPFPGRSPISPLVPAPPIGPLCGSAKCGAGEVCGPAATCLVPCMGAFGAPPGSTAGAPPAGFCWAGDWCGAPLPPPPRVPAGGGGVLDEGVGSPPDGGGVGVVSLGSCCSTGRMRWGLVWDTAANVDIVLATPTGAIISPRTLGPGPTTDWGRLQRESQGGGPECVWWEPGTPLPPPKGTYRVCAVLGEPQAVPVTIAAVAAAPVPASCTSPDCRPLALTANRTILSYTAAPDQYSYCDERHPGFIARAQWCGGTRCEAEDCDGVPCDPDTHVCVPAGALAGAGPAASGRRCVAVCGTWFCGEGQACVQGTCVTNGRLRVTLTWSRPADVDILVTTPFGNLVAAPTQRSAFTDFGAVEFVGLPFDSDVTRGPENIWWVAAGGTPPSGTYHVCGVLRDHSSTPPPPGGAASADAPPPPASAAPLVVTAAAVGAEAGLDVSASRELPISGWGPGDDAACDPSSRGYITSFNWCPGGNCTTTCGGAVCAPGQSCVGLQCRTRCGGQFTVCAATDTCLPPAQADGAVGPSCVRTAGVALRFTLMWDASRGDMDAVVQTPTGTVIYSLDSRAGDANAGQPRAGPRSDWAQLAVGSRGAENVFWLEPPPPPPGLPPPPAGGQLGSGGTGGGVGAGAPPAASDPPPPPEGIYYLCAVAFEAPLPLNVTYQAVGAAGRLNTTTTRTLTPAAADRSGYRACTEDSPGFITAVVWCPGTVLPTGGCPAPPPRACGAVASCAIPWALLPAGPPPPPPAPPGPPAPRPTQTGRAGGGAPRAARHLLGAGMGYEGATEQAWWAEGVVGASGQAAERRQLASSAVQSKESLWPGTWGAVRRAAQAGPGQGQQALVCADRAAWPGPLCAVPCFNTSNAGSGSSGSSSGAWPADFCRPDIQVCVSGRCQDTLLRFALVVAAAPGSSSGSGAAGAASPSGPSLWESWDAVVADPAGRVVSARRPGAQLAGGEGGAGAAADPSLGRVAADGGAGGVAQSVVWLPSQAPLEGTYHLCAVWRGGAAGVAPPAGVALSYRALGASRGLDTTLVMASGPPAAADPNGYVTCHQGSPGYVGSVDWCLPGGANGGTSCPPGPRCGAEPACAAGRVCIDLGADPAQGQGQGVAPAPQCRLACGTAPYGVSYCPPNLSGCTAAGACSLPQPALRLALRAVEPLAGDVALVVQTPAGRVVSPRTPGPSPATDWGALAALALAAGGGGGAEAVWGSGVPPPAPGPYFVCAVAPAVDASAGLPPWHPGGRDSLAVELKSAGVGGAELRPAGSGGGGNGTVVVEVPRLKGAESLDVAYSRCGPDHPGFVARIDWCPAPGAPAGAATASAGSGYPAGGGTVAVGRDPPASPACPRGSANRIAATCTALGGGPAPGSRPGGGCSGGEVCAVLDPTQGPTCKTPCGSYDTGMSYCDPEREACMEVLSWADLAGGGQQRSGPGPGPGLGPGPGPQLLPQGSGSGSGAAVQSQAVLSAALRGGRARHVCVGRGRLGVAIVWSEDGPVDLLVATPGGKLVGPTSTAPGPETDWGVYDARGGAGGAWRAVYWPASGAEPPAGTYRVCAVPRAPSPRLPLLVTLTVAPAPGHAPDGRELPAPPPPPPDPGLAFPAPAPPRTLSYTKLLYGAGFNASYCDERSPGFIADFKWCPGGGGLGCNAGWCSGYSCREAPRLGEGGHPLAPPGTPGAQAAAGAGSGPADEFRGETCMYGACTGWCGGPFTYC